MKKSRLPFLNFKFIFNTNTLKVNTMSKFFVFMFNFLFIEKLIKKTKFSEITASKLSKKKINILQNFSISLKGREINNNNMKKNGNYIRLIKLVLIIEI